MEKGAQNILTKNTIGFCNKFKIILTVLAVFLILILGFVIFQALNAKDFYNCDVKKIIDESGEKNHLLQDAVYQTRTLLAEV